MNDFNQPGNTSGADPRAQTAGNALESQPISKPSRLALAVSLLRRFSTPLLVALLIGLAWVGHRTGWTMPKFADLFGGSQTAQDDWCIEHAVPESLCVECNRKLARGSSITASARSTAFTIARSITPMRPSFERYRQSARPIWIEAERRIGLQELAGEQSHLHQGSSGLANRIR